MAALILADLHPTGGPEIWSGNQISSSISTLIPIHPDEDGCPLKTQPFSEAAFILRKLSSLWDHGVHNWTQILGRALTGRPYFLDDRELQWANLSIGLPLSPKLKHALKYLRTLLSSKNHED
jgi:hypothetical protein